MNDPPYTEPSGKKHESVHGLRHTAASLMLASGVPLPDVAAQLRYADPAITAKVYSHGLEPTRTVREG
jgi:integrase